ncbi:MAG TPA: EAL domain-containing protein [Acidimicrobiales bacterium]|nr:EAL domain-containing protein [Acidimicrobiales bacterium]
MATLEVVSSFQSSAPLEEGAPRGAKARARRPEPVSVFVVVCLALAVAAASGVLGSYEPTALFTLGLMTVAAFAFSIRRYRPSAIWPWVSIASALGLFLAGGVARSDLHTLGNLTATRSLLPDVLVLPGYALLAAGLLGFSRSRVRGPHRHSSVVLDGLIAALALVALAWVFAVQPVLVHHHIPVTVRWVLTAYPAMSIFLVVVTLRIAFNPDQERVPAFWFLVAGMTFMFIGDIVYMFADINLIHVAGRILDLPYGLAYISAGATVLDPSMRKLTELGRLRRIDSSRGRVALVGVALLIPALLTLVPRNESASDRAVLFVTITALTGAAVLRIVQALYTAERSEARLAFQASHDSLTGLPNRRMLEQHLSDLLDRAPIDDTHVALLFLDLDRFKLINDTMGHRYGDDLLVKVAQRLRSHVRPTDLVTRIGGDEFMIVLGNVVSLSQALDLANRLRYCLRAPFEVNGMEFYVSTSIGLAFASGDDPEATAEVLVRDADTAMNQAKDAGRDSVAVFDQSMRTRVSERVELEHDLRNAVALQQLHLVYQPIVRLPLGPIEGVEALVRWAHPTQGVLSPAKFIPLAEESGLIGELGAWVLGEALGQLAAWRRQAPGMEDLYVSVNLSGAQLHDDHIAERVEEMLAANGLQGSALCLELTESVVMEDPIAAAGILTQLRRLGIRLAIDDFGTEYSSLAYLKRFPVTSLKIDKAFVDSLVIEDSSDSSLIAAIVAMSRALGIGTVAEGVETSTQSKRLIELGCDSVQGYLYSRPVRADRLPEVVGSLWRKGLEPVAV